jgi:hypothetical protein
MSFKGRTPERNSRSWQKNEKLINQTPFLRKARETAEGFRPRGTSLSGWTPSQRYKDNWDDIFGTKDTNDTQ